MEMPPPRIVREQLTRSELVAIASEQFGDMVKAVVDVEREIMALGGELHSDEEALLLDDSTCDHHKEIECAVLKTPDCALKFDGS